MDFDQPFIRSLLGQANMSVIDLGKTPLDFIRKKSLFVCACIHTRARMLS